MGFSLAKTATLKEIQHRESPYVDKKTEAKGEKMQEKQPVNNYVSLRACPNRKENLYSC